MKSITVTLFSALLALLILPGALLAQETKMDKLRDRFKERYPQVQELKKAGIVGETSDGYLDYVKKKDAKAADLVDAENADRKTLYESIAKEKGTTVDLVAAQAAKRNFTKAADGEYLKEDGTWRKKGGGDGDDDGGGKDKPKKKHGGD
jgi:uncharacterized protein YdbL (DUF1318 family)